MDFTDKVTELNNLVKETLTQHIDNDFVLFDLPYHTNIGDNLIWEGEIQFLKGLTGYRLLYSCSPATYHYHKLDREIIILLHGGGNFGDVWHEIHQFKNTIISYYPRNKIIILPQTVHYDDKDILLKDSALFARHQNLIICARDRNSYDLLKKYFCSNVILLVPDMAFCIPPVQLHKYYGKPLNRNLFLRRTDTELNTYFNYANFIADKENTDISDWPSVETQTIYGFLLRCFLWMGRRTVFLFPRSADLYAKFFFKPNLIKTGVRFIYSYNKVYTTRLHAAILCCLLEKPFVLFDNSYGKNRSFFETWLSDLEQAKLIR
jgi:pyruvyl transferase EpsO